MGAQRNNLKKKPKKKICSTLSRAIKLN